MLKKVMTDMDLWMSPGLMLDLTSVIVFLSSASYENAFVFDCLDKIAY